jgi:peptidoglycan/xylan/chitin deacetylase (PgdA/CDA1 family)
MKTPTGLEPIPVLLYHSVAADPGDRFAVSPRAFREHVRAITASGRTPASIAEIAATLRGSRAAADRLVAITFDDGFEDTPRAVSELVEHGLRATVYVTTGMLDRPGALSRSQLRTLSEMGDAVELGAHSVSHPHLDALPLAQVRREVGDSKRQLELVLDRAVETFAYPHGSYDAAVRAAVVEAGYRSAAAVKNAISHPRDDPWAIARYTVTASTSAERVREILEGRGAPLAWQHVRVRTRAARTARRAMRRMVEIGA